MASSSISNRPGLRDKIKDGNSWSEPPKKAIEIMKETRDFVWFYGLEGLSYHFHTLKENL